MIYLDHCMLLGQSMSCPHASIRQFVREMGYEDLFFFSHASLPLILPSRPSTAVLTLSFPVSPSLFLSFLPINVWSIYVCTPTYARDGLLREHIFSHASLFLPNRCHIPARPHAKSCASWTMENTFFLTPHFLPSFLSRSWAGQKRMCKGVKGEREERRMEQDWC